MNKLKRYIAIVFLCGCLVLVSGILGAVVDSISRSKNNYPFDFGVVLGFGAHVIIGGLAIIIAICLNLVEKRLDRIEKLNQSNSVG